MTYESAVPLFLVFFCAYLAGSVPFGVICARAFKLGNLRDIGSGNIGATNVLRTGNKRAAALTLAGDMAKGAVVVFVGELLSLPLAAHFAALGVLIGHCYSIFAKFNGGKGVATFLGILLAFAPKVGLFACLTWLIMTALFRISSLSAIVSAAMVPLWILVFGRGDLIPLSIALAAILLFRHRANIKRLTQGDEPKIKL